MNVGVPMQVLWEKSERTLTFTLNGEVLGDPRPPHFVDLKYDSYFPTISCIGNGAHLCVRYGGGLRIPLTHSVLDIVVMDAVLLLKASKYLLISLGRLHSKTVGSPSLIGDRSDRWGK